MTCNERSNEQRDESWVTEVGARCERTRNAPDELLAVAAEGRVLEGAHSELVITSLVYFLPESLSSARLPGRELVKLVQRLGVLDIPRGLGALGSGTGHGGCRRRPILIVVLQVGFRGSAHRVKSGLLREQHKISFLFFPFFLFSNSKEDIKSRLGLEGGIDKREALELRLVDRRDESGIGRRQDWLLRGELRACGE